MPALLTRMSTDPKAASASSIMPAMSAGRVMSAAECSARTPNSLSIAARSRSMSAGWPKPFSITLAPSRARARAMARPMPLVEPVTTAVFWERLMGGPSVWPVQDPALVKSGA
jgi:hypothetical protein